MAANRQDSPQLKFQLQAVPESLVGKSWLHKMTFNQSDPLLTQLEFEARKLKVVALSPAGHPLAQFSWSPGVGIQHYQQPMLKLDWQSVIKDIQLIHWPVDAIEKGTESDIFVLQKENKNGNIRREIYRQDTLLIDITYLEHELLMRNHLMEYQLQIQYIN